MLPNRSVGLLVQSLFLLSACGGKASGAAQAYGDAGTESGNPQCPMPAAVTDGVACIEPGLSCTGNQVVESCSGVDSPLQCTCTGGTWSCPEPTILCDPDAAAPVCSTSTPIMPGTSCSQPATTCASTVIACGGQSIPVSCTCTDMGSPNSAIWECPGPALCPSDAGAPDGNFATDAGTGLDASTD